MSNFDLLIVSTIVTGSRNIIVCQ